MHRDLSWSRSQSCSPAVSELDDYPGEFASGARTNDSDERESEEEHGSTFPQHTHIGGLEHSEGDGDLDDHIPAIWVVVRAHCGYKAPSSEDISFSSGEVFFAACWEEYRNWYGLYELDQPDAASFAPVSSFEILLSGSCEMGDVPWDNIKIYYLAMMHGDFEKAQKLLEEHPELAQGTSQQVTPIHFAAGTASMIFVLFLIINGADTNSVLENGQTALTFALENGRYDNAITLRAFGADSWDREWEEWEQEPASQECDSTLLPSQEELNSILVKWTARNTQLLKNEVSQKSLFPFVVQGGYDFSGLLVWGINACRPHVVDYVLRLCDVWPFDERAKLVNHVTSQGFTPLQLAAAKGRQRSTKALLYYDANISAKTPAGKTAVDLARDAGHHEVVTILVQYYRQMSAIYDVVEEVLPRDAVGNHNDGTTFGSSLVESHDTMTEALETERDPEAHNEPPRSAEQGGQAAATDKDLSTSGTPDGGFDGSIFSSPATGSHLTQSTAFNRLISALQSPNFSFNEDDERVKIAILDTGIDLTHRDWQLGRIMKFDQNGEPIREEKEPRQWTRIMDFRNFCNPGEAEKERDVMDHHGHGTQVAGIILRLAPRAEIYVARVCGGGCNSNISAAGSKAPEAITSIRPEAVVEAIAWARKKGVHLINMSFGFSSVQKEVEKALEGARDDMIVTFAAMSNDGNNHQYGGAWPARHPALTIGVHSCKNEHGTRSSDFTPKPFRNSDNFMAVGEGIITHWPEPSGGGFRIDEGTSFATPVVTAMAARILAFTMQGTCQKERQDAEEELGENLILKTVKMAAVLHEVSNETDGYDYIHPELLWKEFQPTVRGFKRSPQEIRKHGWEVIKRALRR